MTPSLTLPTNYRLFCKFTQEFYFFRGTKANNPVWARWARLACPRALPAIKIFSCSDLMRYNFFPRLKHPTWEWDVWGCNSQVKNGKIAGTRRCCSSFITDASEIQTKCSHSTNFCYSSHRCIQGNNSFFLTQRWSWFFQWGNRLFLQVFRLLKRWRQRSAKYITAVMSFVTVLTMPKFIP